MNYTDYLWKQVLSNRESDERALKGKGAWPTSPGQAGNKGDGVKIVAVVGGKSGELITRN